MPTQLISVKRESSSRRVHQRISARADVLIGEQPHVARNWGLGGFCVERMGRPFALGQVLRVSFTVRYQGFDISFPAVAEVVWLADDRVGGKFIDLGGRETSLINHFLTGLEGGEIVAVGDVLRDVDRAAPAKLPPAAERRPSGTGRVKRLLIGAAYALAAVGVGGYLIGLLYAHSFRLNVDTAVVSTSLQQVIVQQLGRLTEVYVDRGAAVQAGQPLFRLEDDQVHSLILQAQQAVETNRIQLEGLQRKRQAEASNLLTYQQISQQQLQSANARVEAQAAQLALARSEAARFKSLLEDGLSTTEMFEQKKSAVAQQEGQLLALQAEQRIAQASVDATKSGSFFSGNYLVGGIQVLMSDERAAEDRLRVSEEALRSATQLKENLLYRAPFAGTVAKVFKMPGMLVDRGEAVVLLEVAGAAPSVDAYLTQDEAGALEIGARGTAYLPARDHKFTVEVALVDRTAGFLKDVQRPELAERQYAWRRADDRSAYAKLTFVGITPQEAEMLTSGLPILLDLPRQRHSPMIDALQRNYRKLIPGDAPSASSIGSGSAFASASPGSHMTNACTPLLWPAGTPLLQGQDPPRAAEQGYGEFREALLRQADQALERQEPQPVPVLHSAGVTDPSDPAFVATRRAFEDADTFAVEAVAYRLTGRKVYLDGAKQILLAWAQINQPSGQPIDETRLDGFLWGYDLIRCDLSDQETQVVTAWLGRWLQAKRAYTFGPTTEHNNHKTHHLKILLMLDRLLLRTGDYERDLARTREHLAVNLADRDGASLDYHERDALHYHVFDLEAWQEIALVTGCCRDETDRAFQFLVRQVVQHPEHIEFQETAAPIDGKRAAAGFPYAQGQSYAMEQAARAIFGQSTLLGRRVSDEYWRIACADKSRDTLFYQARYFLWPRG